jgi:hypothetical protein
MSISGFCQPLSYGKSTYDLTGEAGIMVTPQLEITNVSNGNIEVFVNRFYKNLPVNWTQCFCYIQCNPPELDSLRFTLMPGEIAYIGVGFNTDTIPGTGYSRLTVEAVGTAQKDTLNFSASTYPYVGLKENTLNHSFKLFPNPVVSEITFSSFSNEEYNVSILDVTGKQLYISSIIHEKNYRLNLMDYPSGEYYIRVRYRSGKTEIQKIIKN